MVAPDIQPYKSMQTGEYIGSRSAHKRHLKEHRLHCDIRRAEFIRRMREEEGIGIGVHYPAIHLFTLYRKLGWKDGDFPHAENAGRNLLTLPLFPAMTRSDVARVVETLAKILQAHRIP